MARDVKKELLAYIHIHIHTQDGQMAEMKELIAYIHTYIHTYIHMHTGWTRPWQT